MEARLAELKARIENRKAKQEKTDFNKIEAAVVTLQKIEEEKAQKTRRITKPEPGKWGSALSRYQKERPMQEKRFWLLYLHDDVLLRILSFVPNATPMLSTCRRFANAARFAPPAWRGHHSQLHIDGKVLSLNNLHFSVALGLYGTLPRIETVILQNFYAYPAHLFTEIVRACPNLKHITFVSCAQYDPPDLPNHISTNFTSNMKDSGWEGIDPLSFTSIASTFRFQMSTGLPDLQGLSRRSIMTQAYSSVSDDT